MVWIGRKRYWLPDLIEFSGSNPGSPRLGTLGFGDSRSKPEKESGSGDFDEDALAQVGE